MINYLIMAIAIFLSVTVHEYSKAMTSTILGDDIPKREGRLSLNPFKHFEPIGFIFILIWGYGWGKPVRTSPMYYKDRKRDTVITYTVPIISNLILAILFAVIYSIVSKTGILANKYFAYFILYMITINLKYAVFNLIPVYPLCGEKILSVFLNPNQVIKIRQNEKIFQLILMIFIFFGFLDFVINPIVSVLFNLLLILS